MNKKTKKTSIKEIEHNARIEQLKKENFYREIRNNLWARLSSLNTDYEADFFKIYYDIIKKALNPCRSFYFKIKDGNHAINVSELSFYRKAVKNKLFNFKIPDELLVYFNTNDYLLLDIKKINEILKDEIFADFKKIVLKAFLENQSRNSLIIPFKVNNAVEGFMLLQWTENDQIKLTEFDAYNCFDFTKILSLAISKFRTQVELKYSEETSLALLNAINDWALLIDTKGCIMAVNDLVSQRLGIAKKDLLGKDIFNFIPFELIKSRKKIAELVSKLKNPISYEEVHKINTYYITICPVLNNKREIIRLAIYAHDITDYKIAVKAALESEEKFRTLIENASDVIIILDKDGNIIYTSSSVEAVLSYKSGELIGTNFVKYLYKDDIEYVMNKFKRSLIDPAYKSMIEFRGIDKNKKIKYLEGIGSNLFSDPIIRGYVVNFRDITARKLAELDLNMYKYIVSSSSDQLIFIDSDFAILAVNDSFLKAFGVTLEEVRNKKLLEIFGENEFETFFKNRCEQCLLGAEVKIEKWFDYPAGGRKLMDITFYPYYDTILKKISGIVINSRDITERFDMENEMLDIQEKEQKRIGMELHDGLNHNLLNIAIRGRILGIMLDKKKLHEESRQAFDIESLINKAMEESKNIASGLFPVNIEQRGLKEMVKDIIKNSTVNTNIKFNLKYDDDIPEMINLKVLVQIYYIINESIRNAIKHSSAKKVNIKCNKDGKFLYIAITDDGLGLKSSKSNKGMGISLMLYRARVIGANITINNKKNSSGVELIFRISLDNLLFINE